MANAVPNPTPIYRFTLLANLELYLHRGALHAANHTPADGRTYRTIHNANIQSVRQQKAVPCGPCGVIHDYVPFYFGYLSPRLLQLKTGRVAGYDQGQEPLVFLVSTAQAVQDARAGFVFSDGHGIAAFTAWYDDLEKLDQVDWSMVYQRYWKDEINDLDRQRRKQAEFLVHRCCDWSLISEIAVISEAVKSRVMEILAQFDASLRRPVVVHRNWYY